MAREAGAAIKPHRITCFWFAFSGPNACPIHTSKECSVIKTTRADIVSLITCLSLTRAARRYHYVLLGSLLPLNPGTLTVYRHISPVHSNAHSRTGNRALASVTAYQPQRKKLDDGIDEMHHALTVADVKLHNRCLGVQSRMTLLEQLAIFALVSVVIGIQVAGSDIHDKSRDVEAVRRQLSGYYASVFFWPGA